MIALFMSLTESEPRGLRRWRRAVLAKAPVLLGITSALVTAFVWAGSDFGAVKHDEAAYELQAEIFAHGRWSLATPEPSEFFEQTHVLIEPTLASKYPPGHSLLMSLGAMVGAVSLVSLLLTAVAGTLVYSLAVRVAGGSVGLLTWAIWTTSAQNLYWRASMFSELTTSAAILRPGGSSCAGATGQVPRHSGRWQESWPGAALRAP